MYLCPHCHKESYLSDAAQGLTGFSLICGHCEGHFTAQTPQQNDESQIDEAQINKGNDPDLCPISCPKCDVVMHITVDDFDVLADQIMSCPACFTKLSLPETLPPRLALPERFTADLVTKLAIIYLLTLASLALLFTPEGSIMISQLAGLSDTPHRALLTFHHLIDDFLSRIQGIIL